MNDEKEDENPWDDDNAGATLATASPAFESSVPSPITVPPPVDVPVAIPRAAGAAGAVRPMNAGNKSMPKATLVGLNPAEYIKSLPRAGSQPRLNALSGNAAVAPRFPTPTPAPSSVSGSARVGSRHDDDDDGDDAPTMLGVRPSEPLGDSDLPPRGGFHDKDAATMAIPLDDDRLPDLSPREDIDDPTKVGAHAHELHRPQDAHVIVGQGAVGDEATMALPTSAAVELGLLPDPRSLGPALPPQTPPQPPVQAPLTAPHLPSAPAFTPSDSASVNALEQTQMVHGPEPQPQPQWQPPAWPQPPQAPPPWAPTGSPMPPQLPYQPPPPRAGSPPQPYPQAWTPPQPSMVPFNPPAPNAQPGFRITSQIMLLAGVGVICLAIFIIGIVLFVTTKF